MVADLIVVTSLFLAPLFEENLAVLRVPRGLRLIHAYHLLRGAVLAAIDLIVFMFVTTSFVFVLAFDEQAAKAGYIDALYFTVATLATTGFGDITLATPN